MASRAVDLPGVRQSRGTIGVGGGLLNHLACVWPSSHTPSLAHVYAIISAGHVSLATAIEGRRLFI